MLLPILLASCAPVDGEPEGPGPRDLRFDVPAPLGMACSKDGGQCNNNGIHALFCTVDQVSDADLIMCTGPCVDDSDCGEDAVCQGDPENPDSPTGCVPAQCA